MVNIRSVLGHDAGCDSSGHAYYVGPGKRALASMYL